MYAVYVDDKLLYSTEAYVEDEHLILNPTITFEVNKPSQFTFTLPPGNALYDSLEKLKSTITITQDGEEIFRGRITNDEMDFFGQKSVDCESELAYFYDSLQRPYEYDGTPLGLFQLLINNHNADVSSNQQFAIGTVTAVSNEGKAQVESNEHSDTMNELTSRMINAYGGYFRVRHEDGVRYLDYLADGTANAQPIEFGVNLLDLKKSISAQEVFNVLIPQGAMQRGSNGRYTEALKITSVNNGLDYIEDAESIARYGKRIWKTKQWNHIKDADELLTKGREYLALGIAEETTLTIKAVDMHFVDESNQRLGIGDRVRILSNPHGLDRTDVCTKIVLDLPNPENTEYTFGKPQMTLTDNVVLVSNQSGGGGGRGKSLQEELSEFERWAKITLDEQAGWIDLNAGELNRLTEDLKEVNVLIDGANANFSVVALDVAELGSRVSSAEANVDGANANIKLLTERSDDVEESLTRVEVDINALEEEILQRAYSSEVDELSGRITEAEASVRINKNAITQTVKKNEVISTINQTAENVTINASKINLSGLVTASTLQSSIAELQYANSLSLETNFLQASTVNTTYLYANSFNLGSEMISKRNVTMGSISSASKVLANGAIDLSHSHAVSISADGTITLGEVSATGGNFKIADTKAYKEAVSAAASKVTLSESGWQGTASNTITASNGKTLTVSIPNITLGSSGWNNGSRTINAYYGNSPVLGSTTITLPTNNNVEYKWSNPSQGYAKVEFTIGGRKYSASKNVSGYV